MSKFGKLSEAIDFASPREMQLQNPFTGLPLVALNGAKATLSLYSSDSPMAQEFDRAALDGQILSKAPRTAQTMETEMLLRLASLTAGWSLCDLEGNPIDLECTQRNAFDFYQELPWAFEQARVFTQSRIKYKKA